jgi:Tol biopolymer transport system component/chitodextrinase
MKSFIGLSVLSLLCFGFPGSYVSGQSDFDVRRLSFNSQARDLAPAFYRNGLVFCSDRKSHVFLSYTDQRNNNFTHLYEVEQKKPGKFDNPRFFSKELTTNVFDGPASFTADGNTIYFTRSINTSVSSRNRQREDTTLGIFIAQLVNGTWSQISPFRYNRPDYNTAFPCISEDGKQLFFCTDNPKGFGGYDIYVSTWENGHWGTPQNLGNQVNTPKNDVFPFLHKSGRLYFASRGHNSRGDMDIYYTVNLNGTWQKPVRLPEPINSPADDYDLILNANMDTGYFASDRGGNPDIFMASSNLPTFSGCKTQEENDYCFLFYEPNNNDLDTNSMAYEWDLGDGTIVRSLKAEHCFAGPGTYLVKLNVVDKLTRQVYTSQAEDTFKVEDVQQPYITAPDSVYQGDVVTMDGKKTFLKNFTIGDYYWDFGDGSRSTGEQTRHSFVFPGSYDLQLGVTEKTTGKKEISRKVCITRKIVVLQRKQ